MIFIEHDCFDKWSFYVGTVPYDCSVVEECRLGAESFAFGPLTGAVQQTLLKSLKKEALGALSYADLEKLLQGLVLN